MWKRSEDNWSTVVVHRLQTGLGFREWCVEPECHEHESCVFEGWPKKCMQCCNVDICGSSEVALGCQHSDARMRLGGPVDAGGAVQVSSDEMSNHESARCYQEASGKDEPQCDLERRRVEQLLAGMRDS